MWTLNSNDGWLVLIEVYAILMESRPVHFFFIIIAILLTVIDVLRAIIIRLSSLYLHISHIFTPLAVSVDTYGTQYYWLFVTILSAGVKSMTSLHSASPYFPCLLFLFFFLPYQFDSASLVGIIIVAILDRNEIQSSMPEDISKAYAKDSTTAHTFGGQAASFGNGASAADSLGSEATRSYSSPN